MADRTRTPHPRLQRMVACPNCSTPNPDVARFCMSCGAPLAAPEHAREARKVVTVVFADITGSTGLGEHLDPEALRSIMGRWFDAMSGVLERHGGSVEKFIGDAVVAVFGVPVVHEDDGLRAVRAAAEMTTALAALNAALRTERGVEIAMRVGVNTGAVVVGDARAGGSRATGDAVNVAARLQQAAEPGETLVGDSTWRLVRDAVVTGEPRDISIKGHEHAVTVRRLIAVDQAAEGFHRRVGGPMVGRDRELGILRAAFERAVIEERCVLVTVLGSAGVGKSRLVHEFLTDARAAATVLRGRCLPYGQGITWYPVAELLRSAVGLDEEAEPSLVMDRLRARLAGVDDAEAILARLAEPLGVATEPAPVEELFWAIRRFLEHIADDGPVAVVLDDLQWAEPAILDLVEHLSEWVHGVPLLLLAMARPELLDIRLGWGGGKPDATTFVLEPLPAADTERLIESLLEGATIGPLARDRIAVAADGNPLYAEQVIEMLLDDGLVQRGPDGALVVGDLESISVPPTIQALLAARLDRLSDGERRTIERAAVVGKEFGQRDVSELTPADARADVAGQLMGLVRKELIRPDRRRDTSGEAYRFRHLLIRDAAYDSLPKLERAELHEQFADWLERTAGDRLAELDEITGYHLDQARTYRLALGPDDDRTRALALRAGHRLAAAGRRSADRDEVPTAVRLLTQAEALLVEDPAARFKTLNLLVHVGFDEDLVVSMQVAQRAEEVAAALGDLKLRQARLWVSYVRGFTDPSFVMTDVRAEAETSASAFAEAGDIDALMDVYELMVAIDLNLAHWEATARWSRLGLKLATASGLDQRREDFTKSLSNAMVWGAFDAVGSLAIHDELLASTTRRLTRSWLLSATAVLWAILGDRERAEEAHAAATTIADELGIRRSEFRHAYMHYALDDLPEAFRFAQQESADLEHAGDTGRRSTIVGLEAWILVLLGDDAEAARAAEVSRQLGAPDDAVTQIFWRSAMGVVLARRGEIAEADRVTTELIEIADATDSTDAGTAWLARGLVLSMAGRAAEATEAGQRARTIYAAMGFVSGLRRVEELLGG